MKFNEKLQTLRKEKSMSQEALAELLNVSRQAISKWESGASYPEMEKLIALSELFGVTLDGLVKEGELESDHGNAVSAPFWASRGHFYEYKSKRSVFGLPLVHINIGRGKRKAKGIVAIGNISTGIVSIGVLAKGLFCFGALSIGLISVGAVSIGLLLSIGALAAGVIAVGTVAVGVFAVGALSIGMVSVGACSIASHIAIGAYANGPVAIGEMATGAATIVDSSPHHNLTLIKASEVRQLIFSVFPDMWKWIVDLIAFFFAR